MTPLRVFLGGMIASMCLTGCKDATTESVVQADLPPGSFTYRSYNAQGVPLVEGWFTMSTSTSGRITGEWHFRPVGIPRDIGPQIGDGTLVGGSEPGRTWVELNPQAKDNNLQLEGVVEAHRFNGEWFWTSFVGITNHGLFEAIEVTPR